MLLVIFGAGASYDSVPELDRFDADDVRNFRPPLATELFEDRPAFGEVLEEFPQCAALIAELRRKLAAGATLEEELDQYQQEGASYPLRRRQLTAIRFYLQQILWACGTRWNKLSHGVTNYAELLARLDQWRYRTNERIALVTFNYDTLLDEAARWTLNLQLHSVESYIAAEEYKLIKPHGSVNWGRPVPSPGGTSFSKPDHARRVVIEEVDEPPAGDRYVLRGADQNPSDGQAILFPAIAIPVVAKSEFVCPPSHVEALEACIREAMSILVIGWRGTEEHFLEKLKLLPGMAPKIQLVGREAAGIQETVEHLETVGLYTPDIERVEGGFSEYITSDQLETFLMA